MTLNQIYSRHKMLPACQHCAGVDKPQSDGQGPKRKKRVRLWNLTTSTTYGGTNCQRNVFYVLCLKNGRAKVRNQNNYKTLRLRDCVGVVWNRQFWWTSTFNFTRKSIANPNRQYAVHAPPKLIWILITQSVGTGMVATFG